MKQVVIENPVLNSPFREPTRPFRFTDEGITNEVEDGIPFDDKMKALTTKLAEQFAKGRELEKTIRENLKGIGYEF